MLRKNLLFSSIRNSPALLKISKYHINDLHQTRQQVTATASVQKEDVQKVDVPKEWGNALPYSDIPTMGRLKFLRRFLPGGKNYKADMSTMLNSFKDEFGDIFLMPSIMGKPAAVIIYSPKDAETVYRNEGIWPNRQGALTMQHHREEYRKDFYSGVEGLITTQNEKWAEFRSIVNPILMKPSNMNQYIQRMSQVNMELIERMREIRDEQTLEMPENFIEELTRWALESVSILAMDKKLGLIKNDVFNERASHLINDVQTFFKLGYELDVKPSMWKLFATPKYKQLMKVLDRMTYVTASFIDEGLEKLKEDEKKGIQRPADQESILQKLLKIDHKVAKVMAMDMLFAGVDTTSVTLASVLLALAKNPEKQQILRAEVMNTLPQKDSKFPDEAFNKMPYLKACIKEAQRIYPLVAGNTRVLQNNVVLSGHQVPKGHDILLVSKDATRDAKYFAEPNKYLPERWLRANSELKPKDPFAFLPFGFGPRTCIGKRIVDLELEIALSRIVRNFNIEFNYPADDAFETFLVATPKIPLKFKFSDLD